MDSLCNGYDLQDIANKFVAWWKEGLWTPHGQAFDIGGATFKAVRRMKKGVPPKESGIKGEFGNGNGSLMRILPLAFYLLHHSEKNRQQIIEEVSSLTHAHHRSVVACIYYTEFAICLLQNMAQREAYAKTNQAMNRLHKAEHRGELKHLQRILKSDITNLPKKEIKSYGYVIDTLEAALWSFLSTDNYQDCVLTAVNLGQDADTTGAVAGGLAGLYYGIDAIRADWKKQLVKVQDIITLTYRFYVSLDIQE